VIGYLIAYERVSENPAALSESMLRIARVPRSFWLQGPKRFLDDTR
jgi:hypothetical protein